MKELEVRFMARAGDAPRPVGTLVEQQGKIFFEYQESWLSTGLNLSPFRLPFQRGLFAHQDLAFGPLPGVFADSLPDGWGLLLMDRHFRNLGRDPASLGPLERLGWLGTHTMGALTYHPPAGPEAADGDRLDLEAMARQSRDLLSGKTGQVLPQLLRAGGSPGGARPKVLVGFDPARDALVSGVEALPDGYAHWMVKFPDKDDGRDAGAVEYAYSLMARAAGLDLPDTRLFETPDGNRYFGIKRFDREHNQRFHFHSFGNLIHAQFRIPSCDYADLLKVTALLTRDHDQVMKAFRQMVFNVFAHNRDDHAKNFAFMLDAGTREWRLTPAYDLSFSPGPGGEHTMTLAGEGRAPGNGQILGLAQERGVPQAEAEAVMAQVRAAVTRWPEFATLGGVGESKLREIAQTI